MSHAILVSETWLKPSLPSTLVQLNNYTLCRNDRILKRGGGAAIYIRSDIQYKIICKSANEQGERLEFLFLEMKVQNKNVF